MKKFNILLVAVLLAAFSSTAVAKTPKYVFFLIGDGMGINQAASAELYMRSVGMGDLNFRHFPYVGFVSTSPSNDRVTDSAAGGTALATGFKTYNGAIGLKPDSTDVESLVDKAVRAGRAAGVVSSDAVNLATPASFYGHAFGRNDLDDIAGDLVNSKLCFAAGASISSNELGNDYWVEQARQKGFRVFEGNDRYAPCKGPVIYLSNNTERNDLPYALDRKEGDTSLEDFTSAAIEHLYKNSPKGFFLMVEGALIDHACHSRDAGAMVNEVIDFSKSVDCVLRFYDRHPDETLIVVTADHETGYTLITRGAAEYIGYQKCSVNELTAGLVEMTEGGRIPGWPEVKQLLADKLGLWDKVPVSKKEEKILTQLYKESFLDGSSDVQKDLYNSNKKLAVEAVLLLGSKAGITLFSGSHSGTPVGLYVKGSRASEFSVCRENIDIPRIVAKVAGYK
ncbi:MAG: alkaline phosphatase [Bacteroidales bacterium]|nr:alkaline phosphatase [Bacteroidales bacterium]